MNKKCPKCGLYQKPTFKFCPECGTALPESKKKRSIYELMTVYSDEDLLTAVGNLAKNDVNSIRSALFDKTTEPPKLYIIGFYCLDGTKWLRYTYDGCDTAIYNINRRPSPYREYKIFIEEKEAVPTTMSKVLGKYVFRTQEEAEEAKEGILKKLFVVKG